MIDADTLKKLTDAEEALAALEESTDVLLGDVNNDGAVDSADALAVLRYSVGQSANENIGKVVSKKAA